MRISARIRRSFRILVPAVQRGDVHRELDPVDRGDRLSNMEIVVIDDGSTDDTYWRAVEEGQADAAASRSACSASRTAARRARLNRGFREARGSFVLCVDGDSKLAPQSCARGCGTSATRPSSRCREREGREPPESPDLAAGARVRRGLNLMRSAQRSSAPSTSSPDPWASSAVRPCSRPAATRPRPSRRIATSRSRSSGKGWKIKYEPRAIAYTEAPEQLYPLLKQRYRWTRGILQALRKHRSLLVASGHGFGTRVTIAYMMFEAVLWPAMNVFANAFFLLIAVHYGTTSFARALVVAVDDARRDRRVVQRRRRKEDLRLVPYSLVYRMSYILLIDICKVLATFEELAGVAWGGESSSVSDACRPSWRRRPCMDLVPILATVVLIATLSTLVLGVLSYLAFPRPVRGVAHATRRSRRASRSSSASNSPRRS
jgi:cellulose synthase/poly-beta-1,6-N-acetylglucosamine synthase-like glycosyltransferase